MEIAILLKCSKEVVFFLCLVILLESDAPDHIVEAFGQSFLDLHWITQ